MVHCLLFGLEKCISWARKKVKGLSTALHDAMKKFQLENTTDFRFSDMFGPKDLIISSNSEKLFRI